jgi:hypothetical protein
MIQIFDSGLVLDISKIIYVTQIQQKNLEEPMILGLEKAEYYLGGLNILIQTMKKKEQQL